MIATLLRCHACFSPRRLDRAAPGEEGQFPHTRIVPKARIDQDGFWLFMSGSFGSGDFLPRTSLAGVGLETGYAK